MCKECISQRKKRFDTAVWYDYLIGFGITFVLSLIASILVGIVASFIGFFIFFLAIGIASGAGVLISNLTLRAINKRRSRTLFYACAIGVALGAIPIAIFLFFFGNWFAAIAVVLYAVIVTPMVYTRISGIQL
jgi:MFS superfamily sulfate permease-like transporter